MRDLPKHWRYVDKNEAIQRDYAFQNFHDTMAFVNALAFIAHQTNHHPDLALGYNYCHVKFTTHDAGGITEQDLSCAQQVNELLA